MYWDIVGLVGSGDMVIWWDMVGLVGLMGYIRMGWDWWDMVMW